MKKKEIKAGRKYAGGNGKIAFVQELIKTENEEIWVKSTSVGREVNFVVFSYSELSEFARWAKKEVK